MSRDLGVTLRIEASGREAVAELAKVEAASRRAGRTMEASGEQAERGFTKARRGVESTSIAARARRDSLPSRGRVRYSSRAAVTRTARLIPGCVSDVWTRSRSQRAALIEGPQRRRVAPTRASDRRKSAIPASNRLARGRTWSGLTLTPNLRSGPTA